MWATMYCGHGAIFPIQVWDIEERGYLFSSTFIEMIVFNEVVSGCYLLADRSFLVSQTVWLVNDVLKFQRLQEILNLQASTLHVFAMMPFLP